MKRYTISETDTNWEIESVGANISRLIVDYAFTIDISDITGHIFMHIVLESDFRVVHDKTQYNVQIDKPQDLGQAMLLIRKQLLKVIINKVGSLQLEFSDGISLNVEPHEMFEAWQCILDDGLRFICIPGGKVMFWESK